MTTGDESVLESGVLRFALWMVHGTETRPVCAVVSVGWAKLHP